MTGWCLRNQVRILNLGIGFCIALGLVSCVMDLRFLEAKKYQSKGKILSPSSL